MAQGESSARAYEESQHFELTPLSPTDDTPATPETVVIPFAPGPFNWEDYRGLMWFPWRLRTRDQGVLYDQDGIRLEVLDYYADAQELLVPRVDLKVWPGDKPAGNPLRVAVNIQPAADSPHAATQPYGLGMHQSLPTGQRIIFWMTGSNAATAAFADPRPLGRLGSKGCLVLHARGKRFQWGLDDWKPGTRKPLGAGLEVELVKYDATFPAVRLAIHHGSDAPQPMFVLGDFPDFNEQDLKDGVIGDYWYDPAVAAATRPKVASESSQPDEELRRKPPPRASTFWPEPTASCTLRLASPAFVECWSAARRRPRGGDLSANLGRGSFGRSSGTSR